MGQEGKGSGESSLEWAVPPRVEPEIGRTVRKSSTLAHSASAQRPWFSPGVRGQRNRISPCRWCETGHLSWVNPTLHGEYLIEAIAAGQTPNEEEGPRALPTTPRMEAP